MSRSPTRPQTPCQHHGESRRAFGRLVLVSLGLGFPSTQPLFGEEPASGALGKSIREILGAPGSGDVAVAYGDLASGEEVLIQPDVRFHPASTMKVPVMMEVFRQAEAGMLSLDDRVTLRNDFVSIADGSKFALDPKDDSETDLYKHLGEARTIRELVGLMITVSSNLATNLLVDRVTPARTSELMRAQGAGDVRVLRGVEDGKAYALGLNNETTARGLLTILRRLAERKVVSAKASDEMLQVLRGQKFNEGIPAGLPRGVSVAHKTGSFTGTYHDAAIVEPKGRAPYVLVVLTRGIKQETRAHELVARVSRVAYEHASSR